MWVLVRVSNNGKPYELLEVVDPMAIIILNALNYQKKRASNKKREQIALQEGVFLRRWNDFHRSFKRRICQRKTNWLVLPIIPCIQIGNKSFPKMK